MKASDIKEGDRVVYYRRAVGVVTAIDGDAVTVRESASEWERNSDVMVGDVVEVGDEVRP